MEKPDLWSARDAELVRRHLLDRRDVHGRDYPSRVLYVGNVPPRVDARELRGVFEEYGAVRALHADALRFGFVLVSFFDSRHARAALKYTDQRRYCGNDLRVRFAVPRGGRDDEQTQGTLVVFDVEDVCPDVLRTLFARYGEVKDVRTSPNKRHHKFVEYYDTRNAAAARAGLSGALVRGRRLKVEASRQCAAQQDLLCAVADALGLPRELPAFPPCDELAELVGRFAACNGFRAACGQEAEDEDDAFRAVELDADGNATQALETVLVRGIPPRFSAADFLRRVEFSVSSFFEQALLVRRGATQTGLVVVADKNCVPMLCRSFDGVFLDAAQERPCRVVAGRCSRDEVSRLITRVVGQTPPSSER